MAEDIKKVKGKRGPPPKHIQIKNKLANMEESLSDDVLKGKQKLASNYLKYLDVIHNAAMGVGNVSPTNQISCAKVLVEKCEDLLEPSKAKSEEEAPSEEVVAPVVTSLISLTSV